MNKLQHLSDRLHSKINELNHEVEKPVYNWNWIRRLIGLNLIIIKIKYHEKQIY
jgi:uncharacterized protein with PQ loop repeat